LKNKWEWNEIVSRYGSISITSGTIDAGGSWKDLPKK
jgi:hypothetical protein